MDIFIKSFNTGNIPKDWKRANVVPIFKSGNKQDVRNYRPISLTSVIGKIFETIVKRQIVSWLEVNSLICGDQHGFRNNRSCLTNLLEFYDRVTRALDNGDSIDVVYLDFQKAFDRVSHPKLLKKLRDIGIGGKLIAWIRNWLNQREQRVNVNNRYSQWAKVTSGVPQGSVLGPIFFLIFINDLGEEELSFLSKFADDTKLMMVVNNEFESMQLQITLNRLQKWAETWGMDFNVNKCQVIHLGNKNKKFKYYLSGVEIKKVETARDLGIRIGKSFKFSEHVQESSKKANQILGLIFRKVSTKSRKTILPLYQALVRPHLEYAVQFWCPFLKKDINQLEKIQRRATRGITGLGSLGYEERLKALNLFSLQERRNRGDLIETFKLLNGIDKTRSPVFEINNNSKTGGHNFKLRKQKCKTTIRQIFFF